MKRIWATSAIAFTVVVTGCQHTVATPFPPGLKPMEDDPAPAPAGTPTNPYPETLTLQEGQDDVSSYVHATGYVDASIGAVYAAFTDPNVVVDRHHIDSYTVTPNAEPGYDVSFVTHYAKGSAIGTVAFDITWREGVVGGTESDPTAVSVVYEKTLGSSLINLMKGSFELTAVNGTTTKLEIAQRMDAQTTDATTIAAWTNDLFASVLARVHGQPLP